MNFAYHNSEFSYEVCTRIAVTVFVTPGNDDPVPKNTTFGKTFARAVVVCASSSSSEATSSPLLSESSSSSFAAFSNSFALIRPFIGKRYRVPDTDGSTHTGSLVLSEFVVAKFLSRLVNVRRTVVNFELKSKILTSIQKFRIEAKSEKSTKGVSLLKMWINVSIQLIQCVLHQMYMLQTAIPKNRIIFF